MYNEIIPSLQAGRGKYVYVYIVSEKKEPYLGCDWLRSTGSRL